jgi:hypothetical protein
MQAMTNSPLTEDPRVRKIADNFHNRQMQVFMLSNQLPLLEAEREG